MPSFSDHLRGVLVLLHVVAVLGMSIPSPEGFSSVAGRKKAESQIKSWEPTVEKIGISSTMFRSIVFTGGLGLERVEDQAERFFRPYAQYLGVRQSWRMFSTSPNKRWWLEVWLLREDAWERIYAPFSATDRWQAVLLEDGRVRGMVSAMGQDSLQNTWEAFGKSLARRAQVSFPDAQALKIQQVPITIPPPDELRKTGHLIQGKPKREVVFSLIKETP